MFAASAAPDPAEAERSLWRSCSFALGSHFQHGKKRFLRNLDLAHALHPLLAFLLFLEQLALAGDVTAVTLGEHVLPQRLDRLTRDDAAANGGLNRHFEHLARNQLTHF